MKEYKQLFKGKVKVIVKEKEETFASVSLAPSPDTRGRFATIRPEDHLDIHIDYHYNDSHDANSYRQIGNRPRLGKVGSE